MDPLTLPQLSRVLNKLPFLMRAETVQSSLERIKRLIPDALLSKDLLANCFGLIDLTTLNSTDTPQLVADLVRKVNTFAVRYPNMPNVAAVCVYPSLVPVVRRELSVKTVRIASVAGGFPASQTFIEVKEAECRQCLTHGADEIDIVIPLGAYLGGNPASVKQEVKQLKAACGDAHLKVILETGALPSPEDIRNVSMIAMEAGADFIKTSTGKLEPAATPEAVFIMCQAIAQYHKATGRRVGLKPAGGISTPADAMLYYLIVKDVLGDEWLNPRLLRFGASRLANNLLTSIEGNEVNIF